MKDDALPCPPIDLLELATGYQRSKTLFAMIDLALPTLLARRPLPLSEIAATLEIDPLAADRFLNAAIALGLVERIGDVYRNTPTAELFLVRGKPTYLGDLFARYDRTSYFVWTDLARRLREWEPGRTDESVPEEADQGEASLRAQHNLARMTGYALASHYDFSRHTTLLDLGGGTAAMSLSICQLHPSLSSVVVDLPWIVEVAAEYVADAGLEERIRLVAGNFKEDPLPEGFDVALLANLLSVSSEETNRALLARIFEHLPSGGAVVLSGWILEDSRTDPLIPVLFCLEDINWLAPDVERSASTYIRWLEEAGFVDVAREGICPPTSAIVARRP